MSQRAVEWWRQWPLRIRRFRAPCGACRVSNHERRLTRRVHTASAGWPELRGDEEE